jgi:hypothetical protein
MEPRIDPNALFLEDRKTQFKHALCAAVESWQVGGSDKMAFHSLSGQFLEFLEDELNSKESSSLDLALLRQAAKGNPHREFPVNHLDDPDVTEEEPRGSRLAH